jgi:hypothetical protein
VPPWGDDAAGTVPLVRWWALSKLVAAGHVALVVVLVGGGPAVRRWPRLVPVHLGAIAATAAVNLAGRDCPLTTWEKACARRAGREPYEGGFVEHYLVLPIRPAGIDDGVDRLLLAAWLVPSVLGYAALGAHRLTRRR